MGKTSELKLFFGEHFPRFWLVNLVDCVSFHKGSLSQVCPFLISVGGQQHTWTKGKRRGRLSSERSYSPCRGGRGGPLTLSGSRAQVSEHQITACCLWPVRSLNILKTSQIESGLQREVSMGTITCSLFMPQLGLLPTGHSFADLSASSQFSSARLSCSLVSDSVYNSIWRGERVF